MEPQTTLPQHYRTPKEKSQFLRSLFDSGAPSYDRVVNLGFLGSGTSYRRMAERRAGLAPGMRLLDTAAGTGLMSRAALKLGVRVEDIVCLDPSPGMLKVAREKLGVETVVAGADDIPLPDNSFDFITMGFALRHVESMEKTFSEFLRVLRPGGRLLILEITKPVNLLGAWFFRLGFRDIYPALSRVVTGSRDAQKMMTYYWESMDAATKPSAILEGLSGAGFAEVNRHVVASIFSEYTAQKPDGREVS